MKKLDDDGTLQAVKPGLTHDHELPLYCTEPVPIIILLLPLGVSG
jgi:hypothetical protein